MKPFVLFAAICAMAPFLLLAALPVASPLAQEAASGASNAAEPPPIKMTRFVPTAVERTIGFVVAMFPDCSSMGSVVGRVTEKPSHGVVDLVPGESFPTFANNPLAKCNEVKSSGLFIKYKSEDGYTGEDSMHILLLYPNGAAAEWQYLILVR